MLTNDIKKKKLILINKYKNMTNYLTNDERKEKFVYQGSCFDFETTRDLSSPIIVTAKYHWLTNNKASLAVDISCFISNFILFGDYKRLNGFSGFDCLNYKFDFNYE